MGRGNDAADKVIKASAAEDQEYLVILFDWLSVNSSRVNSTHSVLPCEGASMLVSCKELASMTQELKERNVESSMTCSTKSTENVVGGPKSQGNRQRKYPCRPW